MTPLASALVREWSARQAGGAVAPADDATIREAGRDRVDAVLRELRATYGDRNLRDPALVLNSALRMAAQVMAAQAAREVAR